MAAVRHLDFAERYPANGAGRVVHIADDPELGIVELSTLDPIADLGVALEWTTREANAPWGLANASHRDLYLFLARLSAGSNGRGLLVNRDAEAVALVQILGGERAHAPAVQRSPSAAIRLLTGASLLASEAPRVVRIVNDYLVLCASPGTDRGANAPRLGPTG